MSDELPEGWASASLFALCDPRQWPTIGTKDLTATGYPVYGANGQIGFYSDYNHEHETILITCRGATCGTINVSVPKAYVTGNAMALDNVDERVVDLRFLRAAIEARGLSDAISGSAQPQITRANLGVVDVKLAPLPEQHRIVTQLKVLLEQVSRAKGRLDRVPPILKRFRQAVLAAACSGELTREWRDTHANLPAPSTTPIHRPFELDEEIEVGDLPDSWAVAPFGHLTEFQQGMQIAKSTRSQSPGRGLLPILRTVNYATGFTEDVEYVQVAADTLVAEAEDVLLSRTGTIGRVLTGHRGVFHNNSFRLNYDTSRMTRGYLISYLESPIVQTFVQNVSGRSAQPDLTHKAFGRCPCPLPPIVEQVEIVRQVEKLFALADTIERRVQAATLRADKLPQSILSKAFSGDLVPTEADLARAEGRTYETAEALLARVVGNGASTDGKKPRKRERGAEA